MSDKRGTRFVSPAKMYRNTKSTSCTRHCRRLRNVVVILKPYCTEHEVILQTSEGCYKKDEKWKFGNLSSF